jgi:uncharacterized protein YaiE (UPF0345 family)
MERTLMDSSKAQEFKNVSVVCKANVYFNGDVVSHTVMFGDGSKKTLGLIYPGTYKFNTDAPETMEIISGSCMVKLPESHAWVEYPAGESFEVGGKSWFEIGVDNGVTEYICSFKKV